MLLLHQTGSVKIGEVVRYTVTYTPSQDRILPSPEFLYLRVKNSSAIALRAAFVHGPYNLSVAAYPATYNPNKKFEDARLYGVPEFEPMLKAGGTWTCHLVVPETIRESAGIGRADKQHFGNGPEHKDESVSWVIEIASQVIFSTSAAVHYDFLLARDEKSLGLPSSGISVVGSQAQVPQPGRVSDFQQSKGAKDGHHAAQSKGVFSRALHLNVEDTASLWNTPRFPGLEQSTKNADAAGGPDTQAVQSAKPPKDAKVEESKPKRKKHVHLVILTHGLHSNLGSDMLYLKESIDAAAKQARVDARARRRKERDSQTHESEATATGGMSDDTTDNEDDDDEETIVRGFSGNATRTERGIKYLARSRDEDEHNTERAKATDHGPDKHGNETTDPTGPAPAMASSHVTDGEPQKPQTQASKLKDHRRTDSENREATDSVSDLPPNTSRTDGSNALPPVETWYDRGSSVSWSDRDFADSGEESDSEDVSGPIHSHKGQGHGAGKNPERSNSPLSGAYWTEKIVGKGAVEKRRSKSPPNATATKDSHEQAGQTAALTTFEAPGRTSVSSAPASDTKPSDID
ncbi:unnamed protein product [Discula destructiva]